MAGQRLIACANPSTGGPANGQRATASPLLHSRGGPFTEHATAYPSRRMRLADERPMHLGRAWPATNQRATETNAAERCVAVDEAGASAGASPLNAVLCVRLRPVREAIGMRTAVVRYQAR